MLLQEKSCIDKGYTLIAGVDEAGRGPLSGPVVAACVIMPLGDIDIIEGVNDSKKLSEKKRELLYSQIIDKAIAYKIVEVSSAEIDEINILNATKKAMKECIETIDITPEIVLIDAVVVDTDIETKSIIGGDAISYSIACASILAKVYRDRLMKELHKLYPIYNFEKHKGYGTKEHIQNIINFGPCEIHRRSFIKNIDYKK